MRPKLTGAGLLVVGVVAALVLAGGAVAYWTGLGQGTTQTRLGDPKTLVLSAGTPTAQLYPGGPASVSAVAANPNPYVVHITSLDVDTGTGTGGFDVDAGHGGCDVASLSFAAQDNNGSGWAVPPKAGASDGLLPIDLTDALTMNENAKNACQGAVFTVHLVAGS
jgi:hypothetical protein